MVVRKTQISPKPEPFNNDMLLKLPFVDEVDESFEETASGLIRQIALTLLSLDPNKFTLDDWQDWSSAVTDPTSHVERLGRGDLHVRLSCCGSTFELILSTSQVVRSWEPLHNAATTVKTKTTRRPFVRLECQWRIRQTSYSAIPIETFSEIACLSDILKSSVSLADVWMCDKSRSTVIDPTIYYLNQFARGLFDDWIHKLKSHAIYVQEQGRSLATNAVAEHVVPIRQILTEIKQIPIWGGSHDVLFRDPEFVWPPSCSRGDLLQAGIYTFLIRYKQSIWIVSASLDKDNVLFRNANLGAAKNFVASGELRDLIIF